MNAIKPSCANLAMQNINALNTKIVKNSQEMSNIGLVSYPMQYYVSNLSFCGSKTLSRSQIIDNIGIENFPSPDIAERFKNEEDKTLYEIHKEHYQDLLDCKTLDEAKEKYPEFRNVVDAKDVKLDELGRTHILRKINAGKIEGLSIDDFSLELLKRHYAKVDFMRNKENYYGMDMGTISKTMKMFNIKMNSAYYKQLITSKPELKDKITENLTLPSTRQKIKTTQQTAEYRKKRSEISRKVAQNPDVRKKRSDATKRRWIEGGDSYREENSRRMKERWENDNGTMRAQVLAIWNGEGSEERRKAQSERGRAFYQTDIGKKHKEASKEAWKRHPEIRNKMAEIAKGFPSMHKILSKKYRGEKLTEDEYNLYLIYLKKCNEAVPDMHKIIGEEYHNILVEWGLKEE